MLTDTTGRWSVLDLLKRYGEALTEAGIDPHEEVEQALEVFAATFARFGPVAFDQITDLIAAAYFAGPTDRFGAPYRPHHRRVWSHVARKEAEELWMRDIGCSPISHTIH